MTTRKLEKAEWKTYFDCVAQSLKTTDVAVEVSGLSVGDQIEVKNLPLIGLSYDSKDNSFDVATSKISHRISNVKEIFVEQGLTGLQSIEVIDDNDNHQIIQLQAPLALPEVETC